MGAQKGVGQPPYVVRLSGRWLRTLPLNAIDGESIDAPTLAFVRSLPHLEMGARRCLDYLARTGKRFGDLPILIVRGEAP